MALSRPKVFRALAVAGVAVLAATRPAGAQHTADPYKPYNQEYESFVMPQYPVFPGIVPNQGVLDGQGGARGANQFQSFLNSMESFSAEDAYGPRRTGPGVPYYSAYRRYDRDYEPNRLTNENYARDQLKRQETYLAYLRERDPKRRAELYREYTQANLRATRNLSATRRSLSQATSAARSRTEAAPTRPRSTAPDSASVLNRTPRAPRTAAPRDRTTPAPSTTTPRRAATPSEILRRSRETDSRPPGDRTTPPVDSPPARSFPR
jgi:hypothetical protein